MRLYYVDKEQLQDYAVGNDSDNKYEVLFDLVQRTVVSGYVSAAFLILFFIIGLPWNALVIGIILVKKLFT